jgi:hypothetical protein
LCSSLDAVAVVAHDLNKISARLNVENKLHHRFTFLTVTRSGRLFVWFLNYLIFAPSSKNESQSQQVTNFIVQKLTTRELLLHSEAASFCRLGD